MAVGIWITGKWALNCSAWVVSCFLKWAAREMKTGKKAVRNDSDRIFTPRMSSLSTPVVAEPVHSNDNLCKVGPKPVFTARSNPGKFHSTRRTHLRKPFNLDWHQMLAEEIAMPANRPRTKILVDGGDPGETRDIKNLIGFVDGQTTNPSLVAKNPGIQQRLASGNKLSKREEEEEYKKIVRQISPLVGEAGVSIEVFADINTPAEEMLAQGEEMFSWITNAYIKYPCTHEGLRAAQMSVKRGIRINMTLCFSQEQAAAVYAATEGTKDPAYVSPFVGRLDDRGENGMDLVANIKKMYASGDGHVHVLAASLRNLDHLLESFALQVELATLPAKLLQEWATKGCPLPSEDFDYKGFDANGKPLKNIQYKELDLRSPWQNFDISHELTTKGIQKFVADYRNTLKPSA